MATSAKLDRKTTVALERFCKANRITETEAIERGISVLLAQVKEEIHPAFAVYQQLNLVAEKARASTQRSSGAMRDAIHAKYTR